MTSVAFIGPEQLFSAQMNRFCTTWKVAVSLIFIPNAQHMVASGGPSPTPAPHSFHIFLIYQVVRIYLNARCIHYETLYLVVLLTLIVRIAFQSRSWTSACFESLSKVLLT
jgi:hypothetical protein